MIFVPAFLTEDQVLAIHHRMIASYGGDAGLRDLGLLQSAIAMPQSMFSGAFLHDGIPQMAAAYLFHICSNHPFVDGNKRTALASALTFSFMNGYALRSTKQEIENLTLSVASGTLSKDSVTAFFAKYLLAE